MAKKGSSLIKTGLAFKDEMSAVETSYRKMLFNVKPSKMKVHAVDEPTLKVSLPVRTVICNRFHFLKA